MRIRAFLTLATLVAVPAFSMGCQDAESVDSRDVNSHGMSIELDVVNDGARSKVTAALHVGSHETDVYARLSEGEELILTDPSGDKRALSVISSNGKTVYGAEVGPLAGTFLVDFLRVKGAPSALDNKIDVPEPFTLKAPASVSRKAALTFTWDAASSGSSMSYELEGSCIRAHVSREIVGDPGKFSLDPGVLVASGAETESCAVTLRVRRSRMTNACCSSQFGHASVARGVQERAVTFESLP